MARHNWKQSDLLGVMVVEAVATATDRPTTELPPLQGTDALDTPLNGEPASVITRLRIPSCRCSIGVRGLLLAVQSAIRTDDNPINAQSICPFGWVQKHGICLWGVSLRLYRCLGRLY